VINCSLHHLMTGASTTSTQLPALQSFPE